MEINYWNIALISFLVTFLAEIYVKSIYSKYSKVDSGKGSTGVDAASKIIKGEGFPVSIETNQQPLGDHYDPSSATVRLSRENDTSTTVANIAVVAHEFGHVQQKYSSSFVYNLRSFMVPVTNISTKIGYILIALGLLINVLNLAEIGVILVSASVIFSVITLPVEIDASKRGMAFIKKYDLIADNNLSGAKKVLTAAALTYCAGILSSLSNLLYYISIIGGRSNRRRR
ncbi:zinc metallopeptidase [bacterium]|nr:zinc metallopeptidase [bacterium]